MAMVVSLPLPPDHWIYESNQPEPPMPWRTGTADPLHGQMTAQVRNAAKWALRAATMNGKEPDFDPDAVVQNMVIALLGYFTPDGLSRARLPGHE